LYFTPCSVLVGRNRNAFCVVRPPGHHAGINGLLEGGESCGFCIFNNVAAGALYAISEDRLLCERCAIVDIDVHHGNGTEEIVRKCHDPSKLFFFSIHLYDNDKRKGGRSQLQYKFYPGTGAEDDLALNIINVPIVPLWKETSSAPAPAKKHNTRNKARKTDQDSKDDSSETETGRGSDAATGSASESGGTTPTGMASPGHATAQSGRAAYRQAIQTRLLPSLRAFNPDLILISAGFDAAKGDVGNARHERGGEKIGLDLEPEDYAWTTRKILEIADICCHGRVVSVLEGGYGRTPPDVQTNPKEETTLDRTVFAECAVRHLHAMIDPYDREERFK
jgi:acetoin utilization deacetylase AcuC-like enzyme